MFVQHPAVTRLAKDSAVAPSVRVIAFPFAGSNANIFMPWKEHIGEHIELLAYTPPGRAARFQDDLVTRMDNLLEDAWNHLKPFLDKPFILFGHSLGSLLAYEFMLKVQKETGKKPIQFISSARKAPHLPSMENWSDLDDKEFIEQLDGLGGLHPEIAAIPELLELLLPVLRADIERVEAYKPSSNNAGAISATIFGGEHDEKVPLEELELWQDYFERPIEIKMLDAGHFYVDTFAEDINQHINQISKTAIL